MNQTLIIKVIGKWWQFPINNFRNTTGAGLLAIMPAKLAYSCETIYNLDTETLIKNRDTNQNDAIILRMWIGEELPVFKYGSHKQFNYRLNLYQQALSK